MASDLQRQRAAVRLTWGRLLTQTRLRYIAHMLHVECRRNAQIDRRVNGDIAGLAGCFEQAAAHLQDAIAALAPVYDSDKFEVIPNFETKE